MFIFNYEQKASSLIDVKAKNVIVCFIDKIAILIDTVAFSIIVFAVVFLLYLLSYILLWYNNYFFYIV